MVSLLCFLARGLGTSGYHLLWYNHGKCQQAIVYLAMLFIEEISSIYLVSFILIKSIMLRDLWKAFHKSVKPSQWRSFNRYMVHFIGTLEFFMVIFHYIASAFHCSFSLNTQHISLWFLITLPVYFIATFHYIPSAFHCDFSLHSQCISLWFFIKYSAYFSMIFITYPVHFTTIFQMYPWVVHCDFSFHTHFIWMPGTFNDYFILSSRIFHCYKNSQHIKSFAKS